MKISITIFFTLICAYTFGQASLNILYKNMYTKSNSQVILGMDMPEEKKQMILANLKEDYPAAEYFLLRHEECQSTYLHYKSEEKNLGASVSDVQVSNGTLQSKYFIDHCENEISAKITDGMEETYVNGPIPTIDWEISNERLTILGFECILAKTQFCSSEVHAYFTLELPFSIGPRFYGGLPGAILKLDFVGIQSFEAVQIENKPLVIPEAKKALFNHSFCSLPEEFEGQKFQSIKEYCARRQNRKKK